MKTTKKLALLLPIMAVAVCASAQRQELPASMPYRFTSTPASGAGTMTYQWYRDGQPIAGATDSSYLLLDHLAYGTNVAFKRGATSSVCPGTVTYTNDVNVAFGLKVGNVYWASRNVAAYQTFAADPDMYTQFYQWNRSQAWSATAENVTNWSSTPITDPAWTFNPCPAGWRLPTVAEFQALLNSGSFWVEANSVRGNTVAGRFFGPNRATCTLPSNMFNCIFLPAGGYRIEASGLLAAYGERGLYWPGENTGNINASSFLDFTSTSAIISGAVKTQGFTLRCVQTVQ